MKKIMRSRSRFQSILVCGIGFLMIILFTACAGVVSTTGTTTGATTITGRVVSVNTPRNSAILNVSGQQVTVSGLTDQEVTTLQAQVGKTFTLQVTQSSGNSYTMNPNSTPELNETNTPEANPTEIIQPTEPSTSFEQGSISFMGTVQSITPNRIAVSMPNGQTLAMSTNNQTDLSDFNGTLPAANTLVGVETTANPDGSFIATAVKHATPGDLDQNVVDYQAITTSPVGTNAVLHFKVANQSYNFPISSSADLGDFNNNARAIETNLHVKVEVRFNGSTGTVIKVGKSNN
ncbi:MAG: hypothetical protein NVS4B7_08550 [Ktedonobacteraceae bacterium]